MNLARNSFSLRKCQSFAVLAAVMSNLREGHLGLRFAQQRRLGGLNFRFGTSHSETSSVSRMFQCSPSGRRPRLSLSLLLVCFPAMSQHQGQIFGCFIHTMRDRFLTGALQITRGPRFHSKPLERNVFRPGGAGSQCCSGAHGLREVLRQGQELLPPETQTGPFWGDSSTLQRTPGFMASH